MHLPNDTVLDFDRVRPGRLASNGVVAAVLLSALILAVCLGPRIRIDALSVDAKDIDIRLQDVLLFPALAFIALSKRSFGSPPILKLFGYWLVIFLWGVLFGLSLHLLFNPEVSAFRRIAFTGRAIELFVISTVIAELYARAGRLGMQAVLRVIHWSAVCNFAWVAYQYLTGDVGTVFGSQVGDLIYSYGPKLVGEASAFGTGQFFAFVTAVGIAELRSGGHPKKTAMSMVTMGSVGAVLSESRISIGAVLLMVGVLLVVSTSRKRFFRASGVVAGCLATGTAALFVLPHLDGRLSTAGIENGLNDRIAYIWRPLFEYVLGSPLIGVGAGGLLPSLPRDEAHNIYLRAMLDFGVVFGSIFIGMIVYVMVLSYRLGKDTDDPQLKLFGNLAFLSTVCVLFSGFVQDALTGVMSSHLSMIGVGLFAAAYAMSRNAHTNELTGNTEHVAIMFPLSPLSRSERGMTH